MVAAAAGLGTPLLLAAAAVCLGFLAFLPTAYVGIAELGMIAGIGMLVALAFNATLLPALLMLFKPGRPRAEMGSAVFAPVDRFLLHRRRLVLGVFAVAMLLGIGSLALVRFDFNPLHLRNPKGEAMATIAELMRDPQRDPNTIDILTPNVAAARGLAARLARLPQVGQALTIDSFVPEDQGPKLAAIANAQAVLDFSLNPFMPTPPASDADTIAALRRTAQGLRQASAKPGAASDDARRLAAALGRLAAGPPAGRTRATTLLVPPLNAMLGQIRQALQAQPVTLASLPADIKTDWIGRNGQSRVQLTADRERAQRRRPRALRPARRRRSRRRRPAPRSRRRRRRTPWRWRSSRRACSR